MPKCSVNLYPTLESSSYTSPAEFVVPPNSTYEVRPLSCAGGLAWAKADAATRMAMIKTMKQKNYDYSSLVRAPYLVMSEPISPGKVGNHYCHGNGHGTRFRLLRFFQNASSTPFASEASNQG